MTIRLKALAAATALACAAAAAPAHAAILFAQDFSSSLTADETLGGRFGVAGGRMGHVSGGNYVDNERSYYQLKADLTHVTDAVFSFDWTNDIEPGWDGWNLLIAPVGSAFDPHQPVAASPPIYNRFVTALDSVGVTSVAAGHAMFNLTPYAGTTVNLRLQFASDGSRVRPGVQFDNIQLSGTPTPVSTAPEPASWALMIAGFLGAGGALRTAGRRGLLRTV
jgi:hypothetical protein